jgi:hypothetical protein
MLFFRENRTDIFDKAILAQKKIAKRDSLSTLLDRKTDRRPIGQDRRRTGGQWDGQGLGPAQTQAGDESSQPGRHTVPKAAKISDYFVYIYLGASPLAGKFSRLLSEIYREI